MGDPNAFKTAPARPWQPEQHRLRLALLGKMIEELNECGGIAARCVIQGIDEREPVTQLLNREALEQEIADVQATMDLVVLRFRLNRLAIQDRADKKRLHLGGWHGRLETESGDV